MTIGQAVSILAASAALSLFVAALAWGWLSERGDG